MCSKWVLQPERRYIEPWKFLTYCLLHVNGYRLLINVIGQLILGFNLEITHSSWTVSLIYILGAITGGVGSKATNSKNDLSPLLGASGISFIRDAGRGHGIFVLKNDFCGLLHKYNLFRWPIFSYWSSYGSSYNKLARRQDEFLCYL